MSEHFNERHTAVPGRRQLLTLDVAEQSLPSLLKGIDAVRVWITERENGVYTFHATQTLGQSRDEPGEPAVDILRRLVNDFADLLDADDVPARLGERWDAMVAEYERLTKPPSHPVGGA